jgi:hypothetical protein
MIPSFIIVNGALWPILPPGIYDASISEIEIRYATNSHRKQLFEGLKNALNNLFSSGCQQIFLDGSFVTAKPKPNDYEVAWDPRFVDPNILDPVFLDFTHGTIHQKKKYLGEFFPSTITEAKSGKLFLDFFQIEKNTGTKKGIIRLQKY